MTNTNGTLDIILKVSDLMTFYGAIHKGMSREVFKRLLDLSWQKIDEAQSANDKSKTRVSYSVAVIQALRMEMHYRKILPRVEAISDNAELKNYAPWRDGISYEDGLLNIAKSLRDIHKIDSDDTVPNLDAE